MIQDIPTVFELMQRLVTEASEISPGWNFMESPEN